MSFVCAISIDLDVVRQVCITLVLCMQILHYQYSLTLTINH